jgi:hypothetical protein
MLEEFGEDRFQTSVDHFSAVIAAEKELIERELIERERAEEDRRELARIEKQAEERAQREIEAKRGREFTYITLGILIPVAIFSIYHGSKRPQVTFIQNEPAPDAPETIEKAPEVTMRTLRYESDSFLWTISPLEEKKLASSAGEGIQISNVLIWAQDSNAWMNGGKLKIQNDSSLGASTAVTCMLSASDGDKFMQKTNRCTVAMDGEIYEYPERAGLIIDPCSVTELEN